MSAEGSALARTLRPHRDDRITLAAVCIVVAARGGPTPPAAGLQALYRRAGL